MTGRQCAQVVRCTPQSLHECQLVGPLPGSLATALNSGAMAVKKMQLSEWEKLTAGSDSHRAKLLGDSPGGIAARLGISRQAVHDAINKGRLDAVAVYEGRTLRMYMIPEASLQAYRERLSTNLSKRLAALRQAT